MTDQDKGFTYTATSDSVGRYTLRGLPPARYRLSVEAVGFRKTVQDGIVLEVNQNATINVKLELGTQAQAVEVTGAAPVLATQDAATGQVLDRTFINDLPLLGRSVFDLAMLTPGVTQPAQTAWRVNTENNFVSNGGRNSSADILVDGVGTTTPRSDPGIMSVTYQPSVDAVQEFKVQQSNFSAEFGFSGATVVNVVTRAGTNAFHGVAYDFLRNNVLAANDFFSNAAGVKLPARRYNLFGFTVGGPIRKDRTFFFFDYEGLRERNALVSRAGVPSLAMREGDFGEICGAGFDGSGMCLDPGGQLWDPYSGVYDASAGGPVRSAFIPFNNFATYQSPGNPKLNGTGYQLAPVPGNLIDSVALKMMQFYPPPNLGVGSASYDRFNNWLKASSIPNTKNNFDVKIDHRFGQNDTISGRFTRDLQLARDPDCFGNVGDPCSLGPETYRAHLVAINYNHVFSAGSLLNVSLGITRFYSLGGAGIMVDYPKYDPITELGLPSYVGLSGLRALPAIVIGNYAMASPNNSLGSQPWAVIPRGRETHHLLGTVSRVQGRHELKFGGEGRLMRVNNAQFGAPAGLYDFEFNGTSQNPSGGGGDAMASFLMGVGLPGGWGMYEVSNFVSTQSFLYAGFIQDNWRKTDKLTINLGLRYELATPRTERHNRMSYIDPTAPSPLEVPGLPGLRGGLGFVDAKNRYNYGSDWNNLGPRVGFAYRLTDRTALRGGYGLFYQLRKSSAVGTGATGFLGYYLDTNWIFSYQNDGATPWGRLANPFPITGPRLPPGNSQGLLTNVGTGINGPLRAVLATPYEQTWSFGIQHELPGAVLVEANYVGKKGTKLYFGGAGELNHLGPDLINYTPAQIAALNRFVPNPFYGIITEGDLTGPEVHNYQLMLPFPQFTGVGADDPPVANAIYHSLQLRVEKKLAKGFQMLGTYSFSKSIDDASVSGGNVTWLGGFTSLQDPNRRFLERSLSQFDIPHVLNFSYVYEIPLGRGKHWGTNWNPWLDGFLGGWRTNGIWRFSSGQPIHLSLSGGVSLPTYGSQRPNLVGSLKRNSGSNWLEQYFVNPDLAVAPEPYALGTAPRMLPNVRNPGLKIANLSLFKEIPLGGVREGMRLEFRAEGFNAFNTPQFCGPNTEVNGGSFGKVTSTCSQAREVQMALKLYW